MIEKFARIKKTREENTCLENQKWENKYIKKQLKNKISPYFKYSY